MHLNHSLLVCVALVLAVWHESHCQGQVQKWAVTVTVLLVKCSTDEALHGGHSGKASSLYGTLLKEYLEIVRKLGSLLVEAKSPYVAALSVWPFPLVPFPVRSLVKVHIRLTELGTLSMSSSLAVFSLSRVACLLARSEEVELGCF